MDNLREALSSTRNAHECLTPGREVQEMPTSTAMHSEKDWAISLTYGAAVCVCVCLDHSGIEYVWEACSGTFIRQTCWDTNRFSKV